MRNHRPTKKTFNRIHNNKSRYDIENEVDRLKSLGKINEAVELLKNEAYLTNNEHLIFKLGKIYMSIYRYKDALDEFLKIEGVSTIKPFFIYSKMALCYYYVKKYDLAFEYRMKAYENDIQKDEESLRFLMIAARKVKRADECLKYINEYPKIQDKKTRIQILYVYEDLGMYQEALNYINKFNLTPEKPYDNILFAKIYYLIGNFRKANQYITMVDSCNDPNFKLVKAKIKNKLYQFDECIDLLESLISDGYYLESTYYWLIATYLKAGRINKAQEILDKNLDDENNMINQASIDICKKNYSHARELLEYVIATNESKRFEALFSLAFLALREEKYEKVIQTVDKILALYNYRLRTNEAISLYRVTAIAKVNLGIPVTGSGYYFSQILEYSKERAIEHIRAHFESTRGEGRFFPCMNLEETFEIIQDKINNMEPFHVGIISANDTYLIDFENAGIVGSIVLNKMQVITFANTKKIITFYPVSRLSYNYETEEDIKPKKAPVKRLSQIEKFNQKYNKK